MQLTINRNMFATLRIMPDSSARNWRTEDVCRSIADSFKLPIDRVQKEGKAINIQSAHVFAYEMAFSKDSVRFYFHAPDVIAPVYQRRLQSIWPDSTIEQDATKVVPLDPDKTAVHELFYKRHDLYSLHTDSKDNAPLQSLLEAGRLLGDGETAVVFALFEPIHQATWRNEMDITWQKLRAGHAPKKWDSSMRNIAAIGAVGLANGLKEIVTTASDMFGSSKDNIYKDKPVDPLAMQYTLEQLTPATRRKASQQAVRVYLWCAVQSDGKERAEMISRAFGAGFGDLNEDNELQPRLLKGSKKTAALQSMRTKKLPNVSMSKNVFSVAEAAKIIQVPGRELQEKYPEIVCMKHKESAVDANLTKGGILLGEVVYRTAKYQFFQPLPPLSTPFSSSKWDLPMQTRVSIGPPGSGKSTVGTNFIVEAVRYGLGAIYIDPAKGLVGDEVEKVLPKNMVKRFNLAKVVFGLDWIEVKHAGDRYKDMLADAVTMFFDDNADAAGAQTNRFLEAAIHGMQTGKLIEIVQILRSKEYRKKVIAGSFGIHKEDLQEYDGYTPERQRQIAAPIFNRLNIVLGNSWLSECMESDNSIDLVELMTTPQAIIFDVLAKDGLTPKQIDIFVNLISTKIMLAMKLRPEEKQIPFWVVYDEPHQMIRSTAIWEAAVTEARKWRVSFFFLFHEWMQLPIKLRTIIMSVMPHLHIYSGASKHIWKDLKEEIHPIEIEDAMKMPLYHAVNVIRTEDGANPVIVHMAAPPSERKQNGDAKRGSL